MNDQPEHLSSNGQNWILVWDLPLRIFHWVLVAAVSATLLTGFLLPEWWLDIHIWAGYLIAMLISFRLVWGGAGSQYSRFSSFLFTPGTTIKHIKAFFKAKTHRHSGHNPAGALMVFAVLIILTILTITGLIILGGQENLGALAGFISFKTAEPMVEIHRIAAFILIALVVVHIIGIVLESRFSNENLAKAMISGRKLNPEIHTEINSPERFNYRGGMITAVVSLILIVIYFSLGSIPSNAFLKPEPNKTYASECGDCHYAYHPSLLPAKSWAAIMSNLSNHFGEDASLDTQTTSKIKTWLTQHASEKWDTEAANNLRITNDKNPLSITATPYWRMRHSAIGKTVFARKSIGSKGNCIACHRDADTGHFDDSKISIPE